MSDYLDLKAEDFPAAPPLPFYVDWRCGFCGHNATIKAETLSDAKCLRCRDEFARAALPKCTATHPSDVADYCYKIADAMLAEREKERK